MTKKIFILILFTNSLFSQNEPVAFDGFAQGTTYHISYYDKENRFLKKKIDSILQDFDNSVSTYNKNSVISKINRNEYIKPDAYFITCFLKAKTIWKNTQGAFDPTVYPLVNAWGFGPGKKLHIEKKIIDSILQFVGFEKIKLKRGKIIKKDKRVQLDFNAFAQGYSVDVIAEYLNSKNITSYLVEIGGEVFAKGNHQNGNAWTIGIEEPIDNKLQGNPIQKIIVLENKAVATSGNYRKFTIENGIKYAHHLDPKTGYPAKNNLLSASLITDKCIDADANATGILVMGLENAKQFLKEHQEIQAFLIYSDENGNFKTYTTPLFKNFEIKKE